MGLKKRKCERKYEGNIVKAIEFIHRHYNEKITIDSLCNEIFLSRSTFLREFKKICGVSPIEYLNGYRCQKAVEQLNFANSSKTEIAHSCGFYDLSHMERLLKKHAGNSVKK